MANTDNKGPEFLKIFVTLTAFATILVALRLWIRAVWIRKVGLDDWVVLASLILVFGSLGCVGSAVHYGLGRHYDSLSPYNATMALKMLWIGFQVTPSAEATAKISITIMLMRVTNSKKWKYFFMTLIILIILITIASLYSIMLSCHPVQLLWDPHRTGTCDADERTVDIYIQGVMAAGYDVILATSPIFLFWNVQISKQSKILLCGLLSLGLFTSAAGIARTAYTPDSTNTTDPTWAIMNFLIWKCVELPLSIIVGCLPTLRPLYQKAASSISTRRSERQEDSNELVESNVHGDKIRKTTEVSVRSKGKSSVDGDSTSKQDMIWDVSTQV